MRPHWWIPALVPLTLAGLFCAEAAHAQERLELRVSPHVGVLNPSGTWDYARILDSGHVVSYPDLGAQAVAGLALTVSAPGSTWALRLQGLRSFGDDPVGTWGCPRGEACPTILVRVPTDVHVWAATADVVVRPEVHWNALGLHALAGVGWVSYELSWDPQPGGSLSLDPGSADRSAAALHLGLGVTRDLGWGALGFEVSDLITGEVNEGEGGPRHVVTVQGSVSLVIGRGW